MALEIRRVNVPAATPPPSTQILGHCARCGAYGNLRRTMTPRLYVCREVCRRVPSTKEESDARGFLESLKRGRYEGPEAPDELMKLSGKSPIWIHVDSLEEMISSVVLDSEKVIESLLKLVAKEDKQ